MSIKIESSRLSKGRKGSIVSVGTVKILNDECITPPQPTRNPANPAIKSSPPSSTSPPKQINVTIAKKTETAGSLKEKTMEHYMLQIQNIKGEKNPENGEHSDQDVIDFIYKDDDENEAENRTSLEITEEIHIDDDEEDDLSDGDSDFKKSREENGVKGDAAKPRSEDIEHVCGKCYKVFRRFSGLKKHLDFCRFDSGYHLRKAQMLKNLDKIEKDAIVMENKDICFCCGESYDTFHLGHINCPDCPKSFKTQTSYERHIFITHSEDNHYPCSICNAKLRSGNLLKLHIEQHQNRGKPFACKICGKDFTRAYHLKRHQKYSSCMGSDSDSMNCKVCNKAFYRLDNLRAHLRQHLGSHNPKKPEYMCPICKNCFYSLSTLNIHTRTHTGERPFDCDLCEKKFPSLVALKKHRRYHTGEKPYTCSVCSQSFAVKEVLNRHMKRHTGERPHKCDQCGKSFIQATQLRSHAKTHIRPFKCTGCEEHFKTEKQMVRHAKCHKRRQRGMWMCSTCKSRFSNKEDYDQHMAEGLHEYTRRNTRRKERTDCAICDKNFDSAKSLHFHILKVHEADPEDVMNPNPTPKRKLTANSLDVHKIEALSPLDKPIEIITLESEGSEPKAKKAKVIPSARSTSKGDDESGDGGGLVVQEFIINEIPSSKAECGIVLNSNNSYTVIPLDVNSADEAEEVTMSIRQHSESKKGLKKSLAESLAAAIADSIESDDDATNDGLAALSEEDMKLKNNVGKLLDMLVDGATLKKFGWPKATEESVLCQVIENCGHDLSKEESACFKDCDYATRMREYVKLLFTVVIHNNSIKELLNNYPIDDVIEYVLGNEDDDDDDGDGGDGGDNDEECDDKHKIAKDSSDTKDIIKVSS